MPYLGQTGDLTSQYQSWQRLEDDYRPYASTTFTPGLACKFVSPDIQIYPDFKTVQLTAAAATQQLIAGVVADTWPGFNASIGATPNYTSGATSQVTRGTEGVTLVTAGFHPGVWVDQSGTGATAISNGTVLVASRGTAGYAMGATAPVAGLGVIGVALLPASGFASTALSAAALVQASATDTLTGTPSAGDVLSITIQVPYTAANPGVAQTLTVTITLTASQATSVTTAATAFVAVLNANTAFSTFYTASNAAGVITVAVNANAAPFLLTYGPGIVGQGQSSFFYVGMSGIVGNSVTFAAATVSGTTVSTASGANLASGAGFKGQIPAIIC